MDKSANNPNDDVCAANDAEQALLRLRLEALSTRFASENMQTMLDFDQLANDGLSDNAGNLLSQMGNIAMLDRLKS